MSIRPLAVVLVAVIQKAASEGAWQPAGFCSLRRMTLAEDGQASRERENIVALLVLMLLLAGGAWLFHYLMQRSALLDCLPSGWRDCQQQESSSVP